MYSSFFNSPEQPFFDAISQGNVPKLVQLLKSGISIAVKIPNGSKQALHVACEDRQKAIVDKLLELGIDVNATTDRGFTPLHAAAQQGDKDILIALIEAGAGLNAVSDKGMGTTPLQEAAYRGHLTAVNIMLAVGADAQYRERKFDLTAADLAKHAKHDDIAIALLGYKKAFIQSLK
jgi:ankyrin repeat protein